ncbi:MAG: hypothetical protein E6G85_13560 [Alphaproteobacteria bacterium]|nr:MAG: hypothetical protein E6G85_13560 [Alphaproteobacteria bacterium]
MPHLEGQETTQGTGQGTAHDTHVLAASSQPARSNCPDCKASLAVVRVIAGRADREYWTMRCTRCGGIHLDIVKASAEPGVA